MVFDVYTLAVRPSDVDAILRIFCWDQQNMCAYVPFCLTLAAASMRSSAIPPQMSESIASSQDSVLGLW